MTDASDDAPRAARPRPLLHPLFWGLTLLAAGITGALVTNDFAVWIFVLIFAGGAAIGVGVVTEAHAQPTGRRALLVSGLFAALGGGWAWLLVFGMRDLLADAPGAIIAISAGTGIALAIAAGWVTLVFLATLFTGAGSAGRSGSTGS